jgi:hypothetical protein
MSPSELRKALDQDKDEPASLRTIQAKVDAIIRHLADEAEKAAPVPSKRGD